MLLLKWKAISTGSNAPRKNFSPPRWNVPPFFFTSFFVSFFLPLVPYVFFLVWFNARDLVRCLFCSQTYSPRWLWPLKQIRNESIVPSVRRATVETGTSRNRFELEARRGVPGPERVPAICTLARRTLVSEDIPGQSRISWYLSARSACNPLNDSALDKPSMRYCLSCESKVVDVEGASREWINTNCIGNRLNFNLDSIFSFVHLTFYQFLYSTENLCANLFTFIL